MDTPASTTTTASQPGWPRAERSAWIAVALVWSGYLVARTAELQPLERVGKGLLMPVLLIWAWTALGAATPRWLLAGLVLATIGDIAIDVRFEAGMAGFLLMQLCYMGGFLALGALDGLRARRPVAYAYALAWAGANVALGPSLGALRLPVLVYSLALCAMAALAAGVSARVGLGALLFVTSDALIGMGRAGLEFPGRWSLVIPTYLAGQYLITTGWVQRVRPNVRLPI